MKSSTTTTCLKKSLTVLAMALLCTGILAPAAAWSLDCYYTGYIVAFESDVTGNNFAFRQAPIHANHFTAFVDDGTVDTVGEEINVHTIRSAAQLNTKLRMRFDYVGASCPDPDVTVAGATAVGTLVEAYSE